jgi:tryptophan synthase alpha chain
MNRLSARFQQLRQQGRTALITYVMAGYPDLETSRQLVAALAGAGADIVEIGIPFSDPLADGPVIQHAGEVALKQGTTTAKVLELVRQARAEVDVPLVLMTYYNVVLRRGLTVFADQAAAAGADGVIIPDLPPEEGAAWRQAAGAAGLATVFLIAPTSTDRRVKTAARASSGFVYCVSLLGVTGSGAGPAAGLKEFVTRARQMTKKPLAVGFGVSTPAMARAVAGFADGVIIGSAILNLIGEGQKDGGDAAAAAFVRSLKDEIR